MDEPGIPDLVKHCKWCSWWRMKCPDCDATFTNGLWQMSIVGYPMHYAMIHLRIPIFRSLHRG